MQHKLLALLAASLLASPAMAQDVVPQSYTFDTPTACGSWCYHDPNFSKLTDGVIGNAGWAYNQGQEWAGWAYQSTVNIDFHFASPTQISKVAVGSTQDYSWDVVLPSFDLYAKENGQWVLKGTINNPYSSANDNDPYSAAAHPFFDFGNLNIHSQDLRLSARANGTWTFIDEVRFSSAVPEAESWAMLAAGLGLLGLVARRRQRV